LTSLYPLLLVSVRDEVKALSTASATALLTALSTARWMIDSNWSMLNGACGMAVVAWLTESLLLLLSLLKLSPPGRISPPSGVVVSEVSSRILHLLFLSPPMASVVAIPPPMVVVVPMVASMILSLGPLFPPAVVNVLMFGAGGIGELAVSMVFPLAAAIVSTMFGAGGMGEVAVRATLGPVDRWRASGGSGGFFVEGLRPPRPRLGILPDYLVKRGNRVALLVQLKECKDWTGTRREVARRYQ